jgi:hypothetical protein
MLLSSSQNYSNFLSAIPSISPWLNVFLFFVLSVPVSLAFSLANSFADEAWAVVAAYAW